MKLISAGLLFFLSLSNAAFADVEVIKVLDGANVYCPGSVSKLGDKAIGMSISESELNILLVRCDGAGWVRDNYPNFEQYEINGVTVSVTYEDYEILLVDANDNIVSRESLSQISRREPSQSIRVGLIERSRGVHLIVRARKTVTTSAGDSFTEVVSFGRFKIRGL